MDLLNLSNIFEKNHHTHGAPLVIAQGGCAYHRGEMLLRQRNPYLAFDAAAVLHAFDNFAHDVK